jgi:hypothetical protein
LIVQLVFISLHYLILLLPAVIVGVIEAVWSPTFLIDIQFNCFYYILYFINQLLPFIIVSSLPKMQKEFKQWIRQIRRCLGGGMRINPVIASASRGNRSAAGATN